MHQTQKAPSSPPEMAKNPIFKLLQVSSHIHNAEEEVDVSISLHASAARCHKAAGKGC